MSSPALDAIVVGSGPNGLAAALTLARAGRSVRVYETAPTIGGGTRTQELTLPGFRHDVCSTILPLSVASPFFQSVDLAAHGVELVFPDAPLAHVLDGGRVVMLERSFEATAASIDADRRTNDGGAWLVAWHSSRIGGPHMDLTVWVAIWMAGRRSLGPLRDTSDVSRKDSSDPVVIAEGPVVDGEWASFEIHVHESASTTDVESLVNRLWTERRTRAGLIDRPARGVYWRFLSAAGTPASHSSRNEVTAASISSPANIAGSLWWLAESDT